jgi:hypothetical protein
LPEIEEVRKEFESKGLGFLALTQGGSAEQVNAVRNRLQMGMTFGFAETDMLGPFGLNAVPATLFVDREGRVVAVAEGEQSRTFFEVMAKQLLGG